VGLSDPDLPAGIEAPRLRPDAPGGIDADPYPKLRDAFNAMPRRSRVVLVLRLGLWGRSPLTLRDIGERLGVGSELVRRIQNRALTDTCVPWRYEATRGLSHAERAALLRPILDAAIDRYPLDA
jgi:hypothetical protein